VTNSSLIGSEQDLPLAKNGHDITIVEMFLRITNESYGMYREARVRGIAKENIKIMENTKCFEAGNNFMKVLLPNGQEKCLEADTILCTLRAKFSPFDESKNIAGDLLIDIFSDAINPEKVDQAISSAYHAASNIGKI
jgi:hypothetical protein